MSNKTTPRTPEMLQPAQKLQQAISSFERRMREQSEALAALSQATENCSRLTSEFIAGKSSSEEVEKAVREFLQYLDSFEAPHSGEVVDLIIEICDDAGCIPQELERFSEARRAYLKQQGL